MPMRQLLNTLYVTTHPAYLHLDHDTLRLDVDGEKRAQVPLHHLGAIVCFGDVLVSPALMGRCADDGRGVVFMSRTGRFRARVEGPQTGNVLLRRAQYDQAAAPAAALALARACIAGKIQNSRRLLVRAARETDAPARAERLRAAAKHMAWTLEELPYADTLDAARGLEGDAARRYFGVFADLVRRQREAFPFPCRSRRPPRDRLNALISFLYALLCNDCVAAAEGVGLDTQMGFLHAPRPGRPSLALDLMEELRAPVADRLALTLVNRRQLGPGDFVDRPGGTVYLSDDGRKTVLVAYQERKQVTVQHPLLDRAVEVGLLPHVQARLLARTLRGDMDAYVPYLAR
jgi:CRISPR-associated protein Cas1